MKVFKKFNFWMIRIYLFIFFFCMYFVSKWLEIEWKIKTFIEILIPVFYLT